MRYEISIQLLYIVSRYKLIIVESFIYSILNVETLLDIEYKILQYSFENYKTNS